MLVLSRHSGESVIVTLPDGRTITFLVCRIQEGRIKVGIDAPKDIMIMRAEVLPAPNAPQG